MTRVTIDASTVVKLQNASDAIELCDEAGRIMGHYYPVPRDSQGRLYCPYSDEEIEQLERQEGGRSWKEIRDDLSKL